MSEQEKEGLVPELRFPEFRDKEQWKLRQLSNFLSESRILGSKGDVAKKITVKLWGNGVFEKNEAVQGSINTQYFQRKAGQFIYSKLDFLNQAFGVIPASLDNFESTVDLPCFDITGGLNSVFLLEYVKRKDFYEKLGETADGSRRARRIHAETFLSFSVALPSVPEQQKIADCLTSIDDLITAQTQKLAALKTHKKGLMQQLFPAEGETVPKLRFPEFASAWDKTKIGNIVDLLSGYAFKSEYFGEKGTKLLTPKNFTKDGCASFNENNTKYTTEVVDEKYSCREGDLLLLITDLTPSCELLGRPLFLKKHDGTVLLNQRVVKIMTKVAVEIRFLQYFFITDKFRKRIRETATGSTVRHSSNKIISTTDIFLPKKPEQQKIADCLTSIDELITAQTQKLDALKTHKNGLMQQLFPAMDEGSA